MKSQVDKKPILQNGYQNGKIVTQRVDKMEK
jgi:hypothetical protein